MKRVLVMGGNGALGKAVVNSFKQRSWGVLSLDFTQNDKADKNIILSKDQPV